MVTRSALPQNYIIANGTVLEEFDNSADWDVTSGSVAYDSVNKKSTSALKFTSVTGGSMIAFKAIDWDLTDMYNIRVWIFCDSPPYTDLYSVTIRFYNQDKTKYFTYTVNFSIVGYFRQGWTLVSFKKSDCDAVGGATWEECNKWIRLVHTSNSGKTVSLTYDHMIMNQEFIPSMLVMFDDGLVSQYTEAFAYMNARGIKGTVYINSSNISKTPGNYCSTAQLQEMYAAGWAIANHGEYHYDFATKTYQEQYDLINNGRLWLINNGMPRTAEHFAYPYGTLASYNQDSLDAHDALGTKTVRMGVVSENVLPFDPAYHFPKYSVCLGTYITNSIGPAVTADYMRNEPIRAISSQIPRVNLIHKIVESPSESVEMSIGAFRAFIDVLAKSPVRCMTIDEWYNGITNPRYRSLPVGRT
jgi:peptidoglycan/xylan/chitin deacetylase (PgdA/CDA1 family)